MSWTHERAKLASLARHRPGDTEAIEEARRNLRAAKLEDAIHTAVAAAPPLTAAQRSRLAAILLQGGRGHG
jgi:hypothetical protein